MISHQLIFFKLFLRAFIFLVHVSLAVICTGTRLLSLRFFIDTILGRWSLISFTSMPLLYFSSHDWLMKILSISLAVLFVMLVGRVIVGTRFSDKLAFKKFSVETWLLDFNKSMLWSEPIIMPLLSLFFQFTYELAVLVNELLFRCIWGLIEGANYQFLPIL